MGLATGVRDMEVKIRKQSMVKPLESTPERILWNSNVDLVIPRIHTQTVYFYTKIDKTIDDFMNHEKLAEALGKTLVPFYPVAGRLQSGKKGRVEINCNAQGVLLVEAEADAVVADLGEFGPDPRFNELVPQVEYSQDVSSFPLLVLQITFFKCGGAALGVGMQHHVADGISGIHFINTWSEIARGFPLKLQPFIDRTLLKARSPPSPKYSHIEYQPPPRLVKNGKSNETQNMDVNCNGNQKQLQSNGKKLTNGAQRSSNCETKEEELPMAVRVFKFTKQQLATLKRMAVEEKSNVSFSSYEMLSAHIWKCVTQARKLHPCQQTKLFVATDGRSRLNPPLPKGYFGNVIFTCTPTATAGELVTNSVTRAARKIHDALARMDDEYLRSALDFLEVQDDVSKLVRGSLHFNSPNLGITSWARMPVYDCDFGWGRPIFMGPSGIAYEGLAFLLGSPVEDGSLSLSLGLRTDHMKAFAKLVTEI